MQVRKILLNSALAISIFAGGVTVARAVDPYRHPNLAAAQGFIDQAIASVGAAQHANEFDMDGHAARARDLLKQARDEVKMAAAAANRNHH